MIGIIGAMEEEVTILKDKIVDLSEINVAHVKFYSGTLNNKEVVLTQSGIGKVNAAISTTLLIEKFSPNVIINTGSAGALDETLSVGDVLVSNAVTYHDANATAFGYELGQIPQMPKVYKSSSKLLDKTMQILELQDLNGKVGLIVSGDSFIGTTKQRQTIKSQFPEAMAVEMEATAIAQTCYQFKVPFIVTRAVSDLANGEAEMSFEEFLGNAAVSSSQTVEWLVKSI
ncbi:5'-methylthioadenosine/S-adenosylhomocysteine nucleosidase [Staphylococcus saccharolyticus]|uniref:5'-methylthioadenosine/S-adenosylhomocysteine nucleosidase n=1 Tax=Staphylococcus saccharolyticus TaxID=33028 RepID=UPI00102DAAFE|nr:5'-methylthioadenosine/S-adenosylhomocysteine nucleosidase [Staphylococcus saccharolyticus]MBL7573335.1 5'-methylthioadenosine/S-adenosylhomocysteine nucleosidase [Staphylococcus saccharolyticus]MBL7583730.1 5'-methylthioadenosine/S-adenosylhomocysteine nucleosidase [Staphylococcus saccharolyticus]MBL7638953.1 5'-methylthioadenosine/S-adenosylhomocysteine nucleosidase [Staphylococcus saccharolyticus]QRJ67575.1 5'-methylthioadenosine/S-adenosylhomocysteine nucleosidase [Staphylococcus sacchar